MLCTNCPGCSCGAVCRSCPGADDFEDTLQLLETTSGALGKPEELMFTFAHGPLRSLGGGPSWLVLNMALQGGSASGACLCHVLY